MWKVYNWTRNTKLDTFISVHHVPYNSKYRYWTGLLLLARVFLYITASVTVSNSDKPQTALLVTNTLVGGLLFLKGTVRIGIYKKTAVEVLEIWLYLNLLVFAAVSSYDFKADKTKQIAIAYGSTIITLIHLVGVIVYHMSLLIRKNKPPEEAEEFLLAPVQPANTEHEVTYSIVERPSDQSPPPEEVDIDGIVVRELSGGETPVYTLS